MQKSMTNTNRILLVWLAYLELIVSLLLIKIWTEFLIGVEFCLGLFKFFLDMNKFLIDPSNQCYGAALW